MHKFIFLTTLCLCSMFSAAAQETEQEAFFTLINIVPRSNGFKAYIATSKETNMLTPPPEVTGETVGNGYSTGLISWRPAGGDLTAEVPNRRPANLKPFIKAGETPLVILKAKGSDGLDFALVPQATDRNTPFYDAVNLTAEAQLEVTVEGKKVRLPRGQRIRLSSKSTLSYEVLGGPTDVLESLSPPSHVLIFLADDTGKVTAMVIPDHAL